MSGAPPKMSAQDFTTLLKRRVVAKSIDQSPQPAHRRYNYIPTMVRGNRADQVVKLISDPTKSCSGGWTDASRCCGGRSLTSINVDYADAFLSDPTDIYGSTLMCSCTGGMCPGPITLPIITQPYNQYTFTFSNGGGYEYAVAMIVGATAPIDFTGTTAYVDGTEVVVIPNVFGPGAFIPLFQTASPPNSPIPVTQSSTIVVNSPIPFIPYAVCLINSDYSPGG